MEFTFSTGPNGKERTFDSQESYLAWIEPRLDLYAVLYNVALNHVEKGSIANYITDVKSKITALRNQVNQLKRNPAYFSNQYQINQVQTVHNTLFTRYQFPSPTSVFGIKVSAYISESRKSAALGALHAFHSPTFWQFDLTDFMEGAGVIPSKTAQATLLEKFTDSTEEVIDNFKLSQASNEAKIRSVEVDIDRKTQKWSGQLASIANELRAQIRTVKSNGESQIVAFDDKSKAVISTYSNDFNETLTSYEEWLAQAKKEHREDLAWSAPANYWRDRAKQLRKEGGNFMWWAIMLGLVTVLVIFLILSFPPDGLTASLKGDNIFGATRYIVAFITMVGFAGATLQALLKSMFSAFHLARDADERCSLTFFYLSLLADPNVELDKEDRKMITQSLFSRSDSGLSKFDKGVTMPGGGNVIDKIINR